MFLLPVDLVALGGIKRARQRDLRCCPQGCFQRLFVALLSLPLWLVRHGLQLSHGQYQLYQQPGFRAMIFADESGVADAKGLGADMTSSRCRGLAW